MNPTIFENTGLIPGPFKGKNEGRPEFDEAFFRLLTFRTYSRIDILCNNFLASEEASYITGQAFAVAGGNTASLNWPGMKV